VSAALPKGGADRVRMCVLYAAALDDGATHDEAVAAALGQIRLLRWFTATGCAERLGLVVAGIPIALQGEGEPTPEEVELAHEQMRQHQAKRAEPRP
jgi:hypothetical protein